MTKKDFVKRAGAVAMAAAIAAASAMPAFAEGMTYAGQAGSTDVYFEKYLIMDKEANVPNVTFKYTISGGEAQAASRDASGQVVNLQVYSGTDNTKVNGSPTVVNDAVFAVGDTTYDTVQDVSAAIKSQKKTDGNTIDKDNVTLAATKKYARKDLQISFGNVTFKEPGVYRYIITESAFANSAANGITMDTDATRVMDVYVVHDDATNACKVEGYVLHNNEANAPVPKNGANPEGKVDGYVNDYETEDLTLQKTVKGNQGSRDEYFKFTVNISNAIAGTKYDVDMTNADQTTKVTAINGESHENPTAIITGDDGKATATFWLQHGQSIKINGMAKGTKYSINEDAATLRDEGYKAEIEVANMEPAASGKAADVDVSMNEDVAKDETSGITADTKLTYNNTKEGVIPTGVIMAVAPFAAVTLIGGVGAVTMAMKKKKEEDEEA